MKLPHFSLHMPSRTNQILGLKFGFVVVITLIFFYQDLTTLANEALQSEFINYTIAIPFLFSFLIYRKRKFFKASVPFESASSHGKAFPYKEPIGALLILLAFLIYSYGSFTFTPLEYHLFALPIFIAGCTLIMFNTQTLRQLTFPIVFLFFLIPPPMQIVYQTGTALATFSSQVAYSLLKTLSLPVSLITQYGAPVLILQNTGVEPLTFTVDIACSGIYSLMGFIVFVTFIAYIARTSLWKKATIIFIGFPLIYVFNILRIVILVLIGNYYGLDLATQIFHLIGGWFLIFTGTILLLFISEKIFKISFFSTKSTLVSCNYCNQNPKNRQRFCLACGRHKNPAKIQLSKRDLGKIAILTISIILIVNLQVPVFALTQGPAEVTIQNLGGEQTATQILPEIPGYSVQFIYRDKEFEEISGQDASLSYAYYPTNNSEATIWVSIEIAKARYGYLHPWEFCLIEAPIIHGRQTPRAIQLSLRDVQFSQNPTITARYFAFQPYESNLTQVVLYWYETAIFNTGSTQEKKHVKISLIAYPDNTEDIPIIEEKLLPFAKAITNYWQPIKTGSQFALLIFQRGLTFIAITVATLAMILLFQIIKDRKDKKSNLKIYNKLATQERIILQAIHQASKKEKPTANIIALQYQKLTGKTIELDLLVEKLKEAEKVGLIKRNIVNQEDKPILTWKSRVPI